MCSVRRSAARRVLPHAPMIAGNLQSGISPEDASGPTPPETLGDLLPFNVGASPSIPSFVCPPPTPSRHGREPRSPLPASGRGYPPSTRLGGPFLRWLVLNSYSILSHATGGAVECTCTRPSSISQLPS